MTLTYPVSVSTEILAKVISALLQAGRFDDEALIQAICEHCPSEYVETALEIARMAINQSSATEPAPSAIEGRGGFIEIDGRLYDGVVD